MRLLFSFFVSLFCCSLVHADVIWLRNGDRLSGEVLSKTGNKMVLRTPYAGKVEINWQEVVRFSTEKPFAFVLRDQNRLIGKAVALEKGGVRIDAGAVLKTAPLAPEDIASIHPPEYRETATKVSGRANAGFIGKKGNTETGALHLDGEVVVRTEENRYTAGTVYNWEEDVETETESNLAVYSKYDHFLDRNWYLSTNVFFLRDRFKDLRLRSKFGAGVGYQVWESEDRNLSLEGGMSYVSEDFFASQDDEYPGARWGLNYDQYFFDKLFQFFHRHELNIGLEDTKDLLFSSETGFRFPLRQHLNATLQYNYEWDNTPAQGKKRDDEAYMVNFGYSW